MERDSHNIALGRAIHQLRQEAKLPQQELADRAGVPVEELRLIECGGVDADWGTLRRLAYGIGVALPEVFRLSQKLEEG